MMLVEMLLPDVQTVQISLQNLNAVGIKYIKIILFSIVNYVSVTCCNEVIVSTSNTNVATSYLGTYTYNSADALVGDRKIYKNGDKCLYYYTGNQRWLMVSCTDVGSGSR